MAGTIRDQGFGLNFNRGFGSKGPAAFGSTGILEGREQVARNQNAAADRANALQRTQIGADASTLSARLQNNRADASRGNILSLFKNGVSGDMGNSGKSPGITVGPVYDETKIQQQVNSQRATNDASTGNRMRQIAQSAGGRGFGANSPLQQALQNAAQAQNLQSNTDVERQLRFDTAGQNASHLLNTEQARESQFASRMAEEIDRRREELRAKSSLAATLASLV